MANLTIPQKALLQSNLWFAALPLAVRDAIVEAATPQSLADGEYSHHRDRPAEGWFGILSGAIRICSTSPEGKESILAFLEPGNWFGEISLFDGVPRTHDGIAHGATELLLVAPADFRALLERFPELSLHFLKLQAARLRLLFAAMAEVNTLPLEKRLAKQLLNLAQAYGVPESDGVRINLHLPQEDLAQLLGASRQRINAQLAEWTKQDWITVHFGHVTLHNSAALAEVANSA